MIQRIPWVTWMQEKRGGSPGDCGGAETGGSSLTWATGTSSLLFSFSFSSFLLVKHGKQFILDALHNQIFFFFFLAKFIGRGNNGKMLIKKKPLLKFPSQLYRIKLEPLISTMHKINYLFWRGFHIEKSTRRKLLMYKRVHATNDQQKKKKKD